MTGLNSPWGYRGELLKQFGWTYGYLLWGISWLNVQMMIKDAPRTRERGEDGGGNPSGDVAMRDLRTKEEIMEYIKGIS